MRADEMAGESMTPGGSGMTDAPLLRMTGVTKRFPGALALSDVSLTLGRGETLAVIGENGAGKSTLMKILGGIHRPDAGALELDGEAVHLHSPRQALDRGISLIHQELLLADNLDIAGNIFLGREITRAGWLRVLNRRAMNERAARLLGLVGLNYKPNTPMTRLSIAEQQLVEIAKALSVDARIVVMDEPTSSLTTRETEMLFRVIADLKSRGISIIYISHRLPEIKRIADRVMALRDGRNAGELTREQITEDAMIRMMIGRDITDFFPERRETAGRVLLKVEGLRRRGSPHEVSFELREGETLCFAGLVGAGRTEIMRAIFGVEPPVAGRIEVDGREFRPRNVRDAIAHGIGMIPEDRKREGLTLEMTIEQNITLPGLKKFSPWGILRKGRLAALATELAKRLRVKAPSVKQQVLTLSGGNQQKVALAKWLAIKPRILILDEPTRGVDVNAKAEIYQLIRELTAQGVGALMVSSDMEEALGVSDRILVMCEGRIAGELTREKFSEENVMILAAGKTL